MEQQKNGEADEKRNHKTHKQAKACDSDKPRKQYMPISYAALHGQDNKRPKQRGEQTGCGTGEQRRLEPERERLPHVLRANVELTGAARLHRAASSDRRERG